MLSVSYKPSSVPSLISMRNIYFYLWLINLYMDYKPVNYSARKLVRGAIIYLDQLLPTDSCVGIRICLFLAQNIDRS